MPEKEQTGRENKEELKRHLRGHAGRVVARGLPDQTPDDTADALAVAIWAANRERTGERLNSGVLDRAAVAPLLKGRTPYEQAVRDAIEREKAG